MLHKGPPLQIDEDNRSANEGEMLRLLKGSDKPHAGTSAYPMPVELRLPQRSICAAESRDTSKQRRASVAHAVCTGQRQSDVLAMKKLVVRDGEIRVIQEKTRKPLWIPLHRDLKVIQGEMFKPP